MEREGRQAELRPRRVDLFAHLGQLRDDRCRRRARGPVLAVIEQPPFARRRGAQRRDQRLAIVAFHVLAERVQPRQSITLAMVRP